MIDGLVVYWCNLGENMSRRPFLIVTILSLVGSGAAFADDEESTEQEPPPPPRAPGSFDAGAEIRFPSGPDGETGEYGSFKWVAVDPKGTYFITEQITISGIIPLAPVKQDLPGAETSVFGGFLVRPEINLGSMIGAGVTVGMLRQGAFLLSPKDFPLYAGDLKFGAAIGPWIKFKYSGIEFKTTPQVVYHATEPESLMGLQVPISAAVGLGKALKVSLETGVYTGDDFSLGPKGGGRIALGAAVDIKLTPVLLHLGAGLASLLVSDSMDADNQALYGSITDTLYFDLSFKYAK